MIRSLHPFTLILYFFCVIFAAVFTFNPIWLCSSLLGATLLLVAVNGIKAVRTLILSLVLIVLIAITNPLFSHNGATILFFINDSRITLESLIFGVNSAVMIVGVLMWFNCFNRIFDSEKLMYSIGRFFPKLALVISMTLGFIPRFISEFKSVNNAQKSVNQGRLKRYIGAFSAVITRSTEGAIITSDSMNARGYTLKGRTFFHRFRFTTFDGVCSCLFVMLFAVSLIWQPEAVFYPRFEMKLSALNCVSAAAYLALAVLPFILEVKEALRWKFSLSKI